MNKFNKNYGYAVTYRNGETIYELHDLIAKNKIAEFKDYSSLLKRYLQSRVKDKFGDKKVPDEKIERFIVNLQKQLRVSGQDKPQVSLEDFRQTATLCQSSGTKENIRREYRDLKINHDDALFIYPWVSDDGGVFWGTGIVRNISSNPKVEVYKDDTFNRNTAFGILGNLANQKIKCILREQDKDKIIPDRIADEKSEDETAAETRNPNFQTLRN